MRPVALLLVLSAHQAPPRPAPAPRACQSWERPSLLPLAQEKGVLYVERAAPAGTGAEVSWWLMKGAAKVPLLPVERFETPGRAVTVLRPQAPLTAGLSYALHASDEAQQAEPGPPQLIFAAPLLPVPTWTGAPVLEALSACHPEEVAAGCPVHARIALPLDHPEWPVLVRVQLRPAAGVSPERPAFDTVVKPESDGTHATIVLGPVCNLNLAIKPGVAYELTLSLLDGAGEAHPAPAVLPLQGDPRPVPWPPEAYTHFQE